MLPSPIKSRPATKAVFDQAGSLGWTAALSGLINLLGLTAPLFMLQVYDRVLASGSLATLAALVALVAMLFAAQSVLEGIRTRLFARVGLLVDEQLGRLAFDAMLDSRSARAMGRLRDADQVRGFLTGGGPAALFDLPWTPLYLILLFLLHPILGVIGLGGALGLAALTWATDWSTGPLQKQHAAVKQQAQLIADNAASARETVRALGMGPALRGRWSQTGGAANLIQLANADAVSSYSGIAKFVRQFLQSVVLAAGAVLIIAGDATGGVMIASSILLGKTLAPVDQAISHWRGWVGARQALTRLDGLAARPKPSGVVELPAPASSLIAQQVSASVEPDGPSVIEAISFTLGAGDVLGVVGPSGAGKSTLLRVLAGIESPSGGFVRLDDASLDQWDPDRRGTFIGYMGQSIDLLGGSIAENISRFEPEPCSASILTAARAAGVDELIRSFEEGFETQVGDYGRRLSAGQRQRIALARALYRDPFLLVLDEPNSALDRDGDEALAEAVASARARGAVVVIAAHRAGVLSQATKMLALEGGRQRAFGPPGGVLSVVSGELKPQRKS